MIYDRKNILSLKLRSSVQLRKLSRPELLTRHQLIRRLEPITNEVWSQVEEARWVKGENSPHGHPWHVSFHASQFPGDDPMACPRQALYQMMDFAGGAPFTRQSRAIMSAGKAIEVELVQTWHEAGILLSAAPSVEYQTGFEDAEHWLTCSVDAIIQPPRWNKPLPVEIKTKYQSAIDEMKVGAVGPDDKHVSQLKTQLAFVHINQKELWPGLDPVTHGYIYYLSRDKPSDTAEFRVDLDLDFYEAGLKQLEQWKRNFLDCMLPTINFDGRHPMDWFWTKHPCKWCSYKKQCKQDHKDKIRDIYKSSGITHTQRFRPEYTPSDAIERVLQRWDEDK